MPPQESLQKNPNLPSFVPPEYLENESTLRFVKTAWAPDWLKGASISDIGKARMFLPQEPAEDDFDYMGRVLRSRYRNFFKPLLQAFAGFLTDIRLDESVERFLGKSLYDIDHCGTSLDIFLYDIDSLALRDGYVGVLVDFKGGRPFLSKVERADILSKNCAWDEGLGRHVVKSIVIRETIKRMTGEFGYEYVEALRWLTPGRSQLMTVKLGEDGEPVVTTLESTAVTFRGQPTQEVPIVLYSTTGGGVSEEFPMLNLAELNAKHFQMTSDYYEILHKCNLPVPVRTGMVGPGFSEDPPPMVIGCNTGMDVPSGESFFFAEPTGAAIASTREAIKDLRNEIFEMSVAFLSEVPGAERTATEASMRAAQPQSTIQTMAVAKRSQVERILQFWAQFSGDTLPEDDAVDIPCNAFKPKMGSADAGTLSAIVRDGNLSLETFLTMLKDGAVLPTTVDEDEEMARIKSQKEENLSMVNSAMEGFSDYNDSSKNDSEEEEEE